MKRQFLLMTMVCMMLLVACNKNNGENQGEAVFTATTEHQGGRTSLDPNNGNINWTAGDQIVIANDNDETATFSLRSGEGTTEGGFGTADDFNTVGPFVAAYPETATIANDVVTFNLPATQAMGETGTFANGANPMVACSDDKNLQFKNLCGGLGIRLKGVGAHVSAVRITSKNTSEKLWGTYEVSNCAANEPTLTEASNNQGSNVITLTCDVTLTTAAKTFFVMLPPGTLANGFTTEVLDGNEVLVTKETTSDIALVERNNIKCFDEILIDVEFDGNIEIPTGMDPSDIIITNFGEDAIPDENGDFAIGYSKMLVARNAVNNEPIYITVNSTDFSAQSDGMEKGNYELSAKETAIYFALNNFPNGLSEASDEKLNALKNMLYSLNCVQQLEQTVSSVVNQYGYLNPDALKNSIETVRNFFFNQLIVPVIGDAKNSKELNPPHADPDHYGQLAKIEFLNEQYNPDSDSWDVLCRCWNGFAIWVGVIEGTILGDDAVTFNSEMIVDYIKPTTATDALSIESYLDWDYFVQKFQDLYGTISEYFNNHQQYFQMAGKSKCDVWLNLNSTEDAICYVGPEFEQVITANCVGLAVETVKFVLGQLIGPSFSADANFAMFVAESEMDEEYLRLLGVWSNTHDREDFKAIIRRVIHNLGVSLLNHGIFDVAELAAYNEYTAMYSAFAYASDLALAVVEYAHFNSFYFEVGGEHSWPSIIPIGVTDITSTSAKVSAFLKSEGALPFVELGFDYSDTDLGGVSYGTVVSSQGGGLGVYTETLQDLLSSTKYEVFTWARIESGGSKIYYDPPMYFTTQNNGGGGESFVINISANPSNGGVVSGGGNYNPGQSCVVSATANTGYTFANWTENGNVVSTDASYTFTVNSDRVLVANFSVNGGSQSFTITAMANPTDGGTVTGGGTYNQDQSCTVTATANSGYTFSNWSENGNTVSINANYTFTVNNDRNLVANFTSNGGGGGGSYNGHDYVDLGLPSGLLWATCNVGADNPEDYGDYFAWGETEPKETYSNSTYTYSDNPTTLPSSADAATANWGNGWRMPTQVEMQELLDNTTVTWTQQNGVNGRLFTAANGNSLFLPAAGFRYGSSLNYAGILGRYRSSSLDTSSPHFAWLLDFGSGYIYVSSGYWRDIGQSVRPVRSSGQK